jgi:hypothetical protein
VLYLATQDLQCKAALFLRFVTTTKEEEEDDNDENHSAPLMHQAISNKC